MSNRKPNMASGTTKRKGDKSLVPDASREGRPQLLDENIHPKDERDRSARLDQSWTSSNFLQSFDPLMTSVRALDVTPADDISSMAPPSDISLAIPRAQEQPSLELYQSLDRKLTDSTTANMGDHPTDFSSGHIYDGQDDVPYHDSLNHFDDLFYTGGNSPGEYPLEFEIGSDGENEQPTDSSSDHNDDNSSTGRFASKEPDTESEWDDCFVSLRRV